VRVRVHAGRDPDQDSLTPWGQGRVGFGVLQNAILAAMYARGGPGAYSAVSAIWNASCDAGMSAGAIGIGLLVGYTGYRAAFLITAGLIVPALPALGSRDPDSKKGNLR
jgi:predicted MFS family arabinose efflux permease